MKTWCDMTSAEKNLLEFYFFSKKALIRVMPFRQEHILSKYLPGYYMTSFARNKVAWSTRRGQPQEVRSNKWGQVWFEGHWGQSQDLDLLSILWAHLKSKVGNIVIVLIFIHVYFQSKRKIKKKKKIVIELKNVTILFFNAIYIFVNNIHRK